jgi:FMN phosphatase YigB (HAD superfamily)
MRDGMSGIRLVSWDVDGTLFSYLRAMAVIIPPVLHRAARTGWAQTAQEIHDAIVFHRTVERQRRTPDSIVVEPELERFRTIVEVENTMLDSALRIMHPRSRALSLLRRFSAAGVTQVALSDFECEHKLMALGLHKEFAAAYSCRSLGFWKPSTIPLTRIQRDFGVLPSQHLHIGDRLDTDGAACARNGCRFELIDRVPKPWKTFNGVCALGA